jgi:hypothetical protein
MIGAARRVNRVVQGRDVFANEEQRFACLGLMRLVPAMAGWYEPEEPGPIEYLDENGEFWRDPNMSEERKAECRAVLNREPMTREEVGESWAQTFREKGPTSGMYETEEEAREFGRQWYDKCQGWNAENERCRRRSQRQEREKSMRRRGRRR